MERPQIVMAMTASLRADFFRAQDLARLQACGDVSASPSPLDHGTPEARAALRDAEIVLTGWGTAVIDQSVLRDAPQLRAVVHTGGSVRHLVTPDVYSRGVRVSSQTAANSEPVAEYTVAMIMLAAKDTLRAARLYASTRAEVDRSTLFPHAGLFGRRIGLIGLSRISRRVIDLLRPFDVDILIHSQHLTPDEAAVLGVQSISMKELLSTCEVVSLHSASLPRTRHLLGAAELALIKDGATFINTARGAIVDQDALITELASGRIDAIPPTFRFSVGDGDLLAAEAGIKGGVN